MDPTEKLYILIELSRRAKNINKVLEDIEIAIKEGAVLDKEFYNDARHIVEYIPILYAIQLCCPVEVIKLLKLYWWNSEYRVKILHTCSCNKYDEILINANIELFLNQRYDDTKSIYFTYCNIFNVKIYNEYDTRHNYLIQHNIIKRKEPTYFSQPSKITNKNLNIL